MSWARRAARGALTLVVLCVWAATLWAQTTDDIPLDFPAWDAEAERAEQILAVGVATDLALIELRDGISGWREEFQASADQSAARIHTLKARLEALPPKPEEGDEPQIIAEERANVSAQLEQLETPAIRAELAFTHADGLIREIDLVLRNRQTSALAQRLPTPMNPINWGTPLQEVAEVLAAVPAEFRALYGDPAERREAMAQLPRAILITALGLVLILRAGTWTRGILRFSENMRHPLAGLGVENVGLLLQLVLPLIGVGLIQDGLGESGVLAAPGGRMLSAVMDAAATVIFGVWIVARVLPYRDGDVTLPVGLLSVEQGMKARRLSLFMVGTLALHTGMTHMAGQMNNDPRTDAYFALGAVVLTALPLYRLGMIFRRAQNAPQSADPEDEASPEEVERSFMTRILVIAAETMRLAAIVGPLVGMAGWITLSQAIVIPAAKTVLLFGATLQLQNHVARIVAYLQGSRDPKDGGLLGMLLGGVLSLGAIPVFLVFWGISPLELVEFWVEFQKGITWGDIQISPRMVLTFLFVFALGFLLTRFTQAFLAQSVLPKTRLEIGAQRAITSGTGYVGILLAGLIAVTTTGINLSSLAIVAGALSVGIGFGMQTIVSNFVSGIILLIERPVAEGDWIEVGGHMGYVRNISVRSTRIETFDRTDVIVPNSDLIANSVTNWTHGNLIGRVILPVGVAYGTDTRKVERILREIAEAHPMVAVRPPPLILFTGFGDSALDFEIRAILRDVNFSLSVTSEINHEIARRFGEEGIEIPFPQRDVWVRSADPGAQAGDGALLEQAQPRKGSDGDMLTVEDMAALEADGDGDGGGDGDAR